MSTPLERTEPTHRHGLLAATLLWLFGAVIPAHADDSALLRAARAAEHALPVAPGFSRNDFIARPDLAGAWLSPDGRHVAWLRDDGRSPSVWVKPTAGGDSQPLLAATDATQIAWSRDSRWLLLPSSDALSAISVAGHSGSGVIARLGGRSARTFEVVDPVLPAAAIVLESPPVVSRLPRRWRVYRVDMQGRQTMLHEDVREIVDVAFDARGALAFVTRVEDDGYTLYRKRGTHLVRALRCADLHSCTIVGNLTDGSGLLLDTDLGSGFGHLARLDGDNQLHSVHADPRREADLDTVVLDPLTAQPLIASYRSTVAASYGLTADARRHVEAIERRLPMRDLRIEIGRGEGARWLVHERAGSQKGERLHLYDPVAGTLREILTTLGFHHDRKAVARLPETAMARKIAFVWRASDGLRLHGFLLMPPGVDVATAPLVANIHGGPFNLFRPEFSAQSQLLANRGYVVFEPNFRGSTGHGRHYMRAGHGDFGNGRVQRDIVEGVRYLLAQGIGDARRVGILGASFGGYAALQGVTFEPELFRVAIAAVPPVDFGWVLRDYARAADLDARGIPLSTTMRLLELDPADATIAQRLREQSPLANVARLRRPVLLLAGGDDERVPIRSVTHYAAALQLRGIDVSLFVDADANHAMPSELTREAYLYLIEAMLHRSFGGPTPAPPDKPLQAYLKKNLLLTGISLRDAAGANPGARPN